MSVTRTQVTTLLLEWRCGNEKAGDALITVVYGELRRLAATHLKRERAGHTLTPTALVNELYMRLITSQPVEWQDRAHFFAVAARQFRRILVDHARRHRADKREGNRIIVSLTEAVAPTEVPMYDLVALDEALERLERLDSRAFQIVEIRFFGGLTENEAAEVLGISVATLKRDWDFARTWLLSQLKPPSRAGG